MTRRGGFASMAPDVRQSIASYGGVMAHRHGTAHQWTPEEARAAGRKGGLRSREAQRGRPSPQAEVARLTSLVASLKAANGELRQVIAALVEAK